MIRLALVLCLALVVSACAPLAVRPTGDTDVLAAQSAREAALADITHWAMDGRLSVNAGGEGGSGRIQWRQQGDDFQIRLSAPVTRKSWVLTRAGGEVRLEGLEGGTRRGPDAEQLLFDATGWRIPVAALAAWARGARAPGPADIDFSPDGLPSLISQEGWVVEYREWDAADPARPRRVFARQGEQASLRLVVDAWSVPAP
ncbi:lipoprotein insertase outer membrane protein LolB [Arenimonas sp. MALMAid1274]|uniref:lipoprotein insertase outer membrane protein LolB n=1 Tax=Arenimonas sp. MALMAid1274 TaxID=3411630 RepID=UPI003BA1A1DE